MWGADGFGGCQRICMLVGVAKYQDARQPFFDFGAAARGKVNKEAKGFCTQGFFGAERTQRQAPMYHVEGATGNQKGREKGDSSLC